VGIVMDEKMRAIECLQVPDKSVGEISEISGGG
jgi:hypothetical protein